MGKLLSSLRAALGLDLSVPAREEVRCFPMLLHLWYAITGSSMMPSSFVQIACLSLCGSMCSWYGQTNGILCSSHSFFGFSARLSSLWL